MESFLLGVDAAAKNRCAGEESGPAEADESPREIAFVGEAYEGRGRCSCNGETGKPRSVAGRTSADLHRRPRNAILGFELERRAMRLDPTECGQWTSVLTNLRWMRICHVAQRPRGRGVRRVREGRRFSRTRRRLRTQSPRDYVRAGISQRRGLGNRTEI